MVISGYFKDYKNQNKYNLMLSRPGDALSVYTIKDEDDGTDSICWASNPIKLECDYSDTFKHVIIKSATIDFVTNFNLKDLILASNNRDISCTIVVTNLSNNNETTLFNGYVEPLCFNEPYANNWESISITATDILASSQYIQYPPLMLENYDPEQDEVNPWNDMWSTTTTLTKISTKLGLTLDLSSLSNEVTTAMAGTKISNSIWIGESPDDWKTCYDVLETLGKYWNVWFIVDGIKLVGLDWHTINRGQTITITKDNAAGTDTSISNADAYTQIKLACNIEDADNIIEFGDDLTSPYTHYVKYLEEIVSEGGGSNAYDAYKDLLLNDVTHDEGKKKSYKYKNFCWVKTSNLWTFPSNSGSNSYITYANLNDTPSHTQQEILQWLRQTYNRGKGAFVSFGRTDKCQTTDNAPINSITLTDYLVISIMGDDNSSTNFNWPSEICSFSGPSTAFTPADSDTTNYIIISGQVLLNKLYAQTGYPMHAKYQKNGGGEYDDVNGNVYADSLHTYEQAQALMNGTDPTLGWQGPIFMHEATVQRISDNGYGAYYNHKFFNGSAGSEAYTSSQCLYGDLKQDKYNNTFKYEYSYIDGQGKKVDNTSKIPILECQLKIGEGENAKYCVERVDLGPSGWGKFEWLTAAQIQSRNIRFDGVYWYNFTIGIDPKCDDYIIGQPYDIQNNIWYYDDIKGKGTKIPIKFSDALAGPVSFKILKPFNITWTKTTKSVHGWLWHSTHWNNSNQPILEKLSSIMISNFKIELTSDKGKIQNNTANNDLVYASDMNDKYVEDHEEDVDICTMITSTEAANWGTDMVISKSHVVNSDGTPFYGYPYTTIVNNETVTAYVKPEQLYVDGYYQEYFVPRTIVDTSILFNKNYNWLLNPANKKFNIRYVEQGNNNYVPIKYEADLFYNTVNMSFKDMTNIEEYDN